MQVAGGPSHRCHVYRGAAEKTDALTRFLADGLKQHAQCRVVAYIDAPDGAVGALAGAGFDIGQAMLVEAFDVIPASTTPLLSLPFDAQAAVAWVRGMIDEAVAASFSSLRLAIEMRWALASSVGELGLATFERGLDRETRERPLFALCEYDADVFPKDWLERAERAHRTLEENATGRRGE